MGGPTTTRPDGSKYGFDNKENKRRNANKDGAEVEDVNVKRDFFGRVIVERSGGALEERDGNGKRKKAVQKKGGKVWVTYHEGLNNAVTKPLSLEEFMRGF